MGLDNRDVAQLIRVLALGARGRKFESFHPDNTVVIAHLVERWIVDPKAVRSKLTFHPHANFV